MMAEPSAAYGSRLSPEERETLWLPLLRRLTRTCPGWAVWKDPEPALSGPEDIDAAAPSRTWPQIVAEFRRWAAQRELPVVVCLHVPQTLNLFAVHRGQLLQLETRSRGTFRGAVHFTAEDLADLSVIDPRGFRVLRPGARGMLKLTLHGLRRGGRPAQAALEQHRVVELLRRDLRGAELMAERLGPAAAAAARAARAAAAGRWDRPAFLALEAAAALRAPLRPHLPLAQLWFRRFRRARCPVLQTVYSNGRFLPEPLERWLERADRSGHRAIASHQTPTAGRFVAVVGPDGVGKTTVARTLLEAHGGERGYVYFRPPLRGPLRTAPPSGPKPRGDKQPTEQRRALGWLRLAKNIVWFHVGYRRAIRPALRRGALVVADRWAYGYIVQPGPLRYFGPRWLARLGVRVMPAPDLVVNLVAPPDVVVARKDELTKQQVADELTEWRSLPVENLHSIDATPPPQRIVQHVMAILGART